MTIGNVLCTYALRVSKVFPKKKSRLFFTIYRQYALYSCATTERIVLSPEKDIMHGPNFLSAGALWSQSAFCLSTACDEQFTGDGADYRGCQTKTRSGETCQRWDSQSPHTHITTIANYPSSGLTENFCRNPDGKSGIWCYTRISTLRWEYCDPLPGLVCARGSEFNGTHCKCVKE